MKNSGHGGDTTPIWVWSWGPGGCLSWGPCSGLPSSRPCNAGRPQNWVLGSSVYATSLGNRVQTPGFSCHLFVNNSQICISSLPTPLSTKFAYATANLASIVGCLKDISDIRQPKQTHNFPTPLLSAPPPVFLSGPLAFIQLLQPKVWESCFIPSTF